MRTVVQPVVTVRFGAHPAADTVACLEHHHVAVPQPPGCGQTCDPAADDHDVPGGIGRSLGVLVHAAMLRHYSCGWYSLVLG